MRIAEALAGQFLRHCEGKGFTLAPPPRRLTIATLGDLARLDQSARRHAGL